MKIGIVVAVEIEAVETLLGNPVEVYQVHHQDVRLYRIDNHDIYLIHCGPGEIAAAAATQLLISDCGVEVIFNYGIVGGLTDDMASHRLCVVDKVVHYDFDTSQIDDVEPARYMHYPSVYLTGSRKLLEFALEVDSNLNRVICASGDKFVGNPTQKKQLHETYGADICEMEAAGILMTCHKNHIPSLFVKVVADGLFDGEEEYYQERNRTSEEAFEVLINLIKNFDLEHLDIGTE